MGNCCGKAKDKGAFQGEGRTLTATPATAPPAAPNGGRAAVPAFNGPGRTLGSSPEPGNAAARAAEVCTGQQQ